MMPQRKTPWRKRERPEDHIHRAIYQFLLYALPPVASATLCHVPNGEKRDKITAAILNGMGVKPGVEDLQFVWQGGHYAIEVKPEGKKQSAAQVERESALRAAGGHYAVCRSIEDVAETLIEWSIPIGARVFGKVAEC